MLRPYTGMEIDGFTLGARLHQGSFATIWTVTHALYRRAMVMKVPSILDGYDGPAIVGFEVEQMILPRLTGPHVPRVFGHGGLDDMAYIVMEAVPGGSLLERLGAAWPLSDLIEAAAQVLFDLQHPGQVALTAREHKRQADGMWEVWQRWRRMRRVKRFAAPVSHGDQIGRAPILLVAVDLSPKGDALAPGLLLWVRRMLSLQPDSRIAVVNIIKTAVLGVDSGTDDVGENLHVARLVALRVWAAGLGGGSGRRVWNWPRRN